MGFRSPFFVDDREKFDPLCRESGIELTVGAVDEKAMFRGDGALIERRVLENLMENALRHAPHGGRLELGGKVEGGQFVGWVKDTGPGIPAARLKSIFEPGVQGEGKKGLAGLGLYSVKTTLDAHGGRVWVESVLGQGATFFFTLPLAEKKE